MIKIPNDDEKIHGLFCDDLNCLKTQYENTFEAAEILGHKEYVEHKKLYLIVRWTNWPPQLASEMPFSELYKRGVHGWNDFNVSLIHKYATEKGWTFFPST